MRVPENGAIYSINEGNMSQCDDAVREYVAYCKTPDAKTNRPYSARYIGSLVADVHRNLIKGGIYIYPATTKAPQGKLRLMYENNPLAFIVEQAGGLATDGVGRILDIQPSELHQRTPLYIGSKTWCFVPWVSRKLQKNKPKKLAKTANPTPSTLSTHALRLTCRAQLNGTHLQWRAV